MNFFLFSKKKGRIVKGGAISSAPITHKLVKGHKNISQKGESGIEKTRGKTIKKQCNYKTQIFFQSNFPTGHFDKQN